MENRISVRYKFRGSDEIHIGKVTWKELDNLKQIAMVEYCEILD
jgi:hypothetical protein